MHRTPWTKPQSSLPSDRLPPPKPQPNKKNAKSKGTSTPPVPKSKAVQELESQLAVLQSPDACKVKHPKGGCFCLARVHKLNQYTPICIECGLILCDLNDPQYLCPHCSQPSLSKSALQSLIARLETLVAETLVREEEARIRQEEAARQQAGAFPTLRPSAQPPGAPIKAPLQATAKVLSLSSGGRNQKATVSSMSFPKPAAPTATSLTEVFELQEEIRIPRPTPPAAFGHRPPDRPWYNPELPVKYVASQPKTEPSASKSSRRKKPKPKQEAGPSQDANTEI